MIEAFDKNLDVHSLTASLLFGDSIEDIKRWDDDHVACEIGDGLHTKRYWGKKSNHCKSEKAEVLTESGWVSIKLAKENNSKILTWDKTFGMSFETPSNWYEELFSGVLHTQTGRYFHQTSTPEHRIPVLDRNNNKALKVFKAKEVPLTSSNEFITSGFAKGGTWDINPDLLCLLVAFQADGTWNWRSPIWKLKNPKKISRLIELCDRNNITYTQHVQGEYTRIQIKAENPIRELIWEHFPKHKDWQWKLLNLTKENLEVFCSEVVNWDGDGKSYWTVLPENAQIVQTLFHLTGRKANIGWGCKETGTYRVGVNPKPSTRADTTERFIEEVKNLPVYCPTVSSGFFLVRENGQISVTGNSLNYDIGFVTFAMDQEIPVKQAKFIISRYHEIYPNVREVFHAEVRQDIMYNRTLTNLMGRKTMFFGKVCDELFKQAYACKPQGTVGDVINERGLNFIYYDDRFKNVKLMTQTHDEVVFQIPLNLGWPEHIRLLNLIKRELETPLRLPNGDEFVIPADIDMFKRFKRGKKVKQLTPTYMKELWEGLEK
jgi:hypothetical protein